MKKIFACFLLVMLHHAFGQTMLVSKEEMLASISASDAPVQKMAVDPSAPRIAITAPNITEPLVSPTPIQLHFESTEPSVIKPETFRVLYGAFGIDITQRLLSIAKLSAQGISVQEVNLPSGKHKLQLSVADSIGRRGVRVIEIQIN